MSTFTIKRRLYSEGGVWNKIRDYGKKASDRVRKSLTLELNHKALDDYGQLLSDYANEDMSVLNTIKTLGANHRRQKKREKDHDLLARLAADELIQYDKGYLAGSLAGAGVGLGGGYLAGNYLTRNMDPEEDKNKIRAIKAASMLTGAVGGSAIGAVGGLKYASHKIGKSYKK